MGGRQILSRFLLRNLYKKKVSGLGPTRGRFQRSGKGPDRRPDAVCRSEVAFSNVFFKGCRSEVSFSDVFFKGCRSGVSFSDVFLKDCQSEVSFSDVFL